jgi:hypothetical protein
MEPIDIIASDLFDKVRSRFKNLEMGDTNGNVTINPIDARFFDFDFILENVNFGRISININDTGSLKIYYSQGITEDQEPEVKKIWYNFLKEMRLFAMRRLLRFDTRDIAKSNLDKNDFNFLYSKNKKDNSSMINMNESRWDAKSTRKTSRAVKGKTEVIVRHHKPVDETYPGARSSKRNIKGIFIQNADGERFKYPLNDQRGAFAMAQHVDHGGRPHDDAGRAIISMSEQIAQLQEFQIHVQHSTLNDDAIGISEKALTRLTDLKMKLESLARRKNYESWIAEFNNSESDMLLNDLDPVQYEDYKSKFTQQSFNEELGKIFPLIHSIMQEKVDLAELVDDEDNFKANEEPEDNASVKPEKQFESWATSIEENRLDMDELQNKLGTDISLMDKMAEITLGPDGSNAWGVLSSLFDLDENNSDDKSLKDQLKARSETADQDEAGADSPAINVFKDWVKDTKPQWMEDLPELFADENQQQPEPAAQPAPEPAAQPAAQPAPEPVQQPAMQQPQATAENKLHKKSGSSLVQEVANIVKRFYNASNEDVGPFRSEEAICLEVEKTISEKYKKESVVKKADYIAKKMMEKLTKKWEMRHQKPVDSLKPIEDDGLSRIKELAGLQKHI